MDLAKTEAKRKSALADFLKVRTIACILHVLFNLL